MVADLADSGSCRRGVGTCEPDPSARAAAGICLDSGGNLARSGGGTACQAHDHAHVRILARSALGVVQVGYPALEPLAVAMRDLARATEALAAYLETLEGPGESRRLASKRQRAPLRCSRSERTWQRTWQPTR
jgi:hypothetical protein